ncbi:MAG: hypothetical protein FJX56_08450 [Alphaproteobacteria bacterium]|nr:hypothetical protein [Alphaproteobacteria bacterium]
MWENWAGTIADIGAIYPWGGTSGGAWEVIFWIVGLVAWLGWHIAQFRFENKTYTEDRVRFGSKEAVRKALDQKS